MVMIDNGAKVTYTNQDDPPLGSELSNGLRYYQNLGNQVRQIDYKYAENVYIKEISDYINKTYSEHYSRNKYQATEFIMDSGHGTGFCMGNVMKYAQRYGRKGSREDWRKDLLKVIHYAMMQLYVHDVIEKETK